MDIQTPNALVLRFGVFELDTDSGELRRHGLKIRLPDQSFQVLKSLLSRKGEVVTREDLRKVLWTSETFVDFEAGLNSAVRKLREALDDSADNPRFVETLPRRGYRFIASVSERSAEPAPPTRTAPALHLLLTPDAAFAADSTPTTPALDPPADSRELNPPARSRAALWRAAGLLLVALAAIGGMIYQRGAFVAVRAGPATQPIRSLVVLPFENLTGDAGQNYFVDAVTDAVTAHLAQVAGLDVISRTSARQFKETAKRPPAIGHELSVDGIVEGSVVRSGASVRITAQLVRAATDRQVWAHTYEGGVSHLLTLQQRIASDVAAAAGQPRPQPSARQSGQAIDPRAYDAYLKGLTAKGLQRVEGFRRAVAYFDEAIAIQPDFGAAYAALALAQVQFLYGGPFSPRETIPKAETAARKALQLDPTLPQAHWALGQILSLYYWRWEDGEKALERAAALQGGGGASMAVSGSFVRSGRIAEAVEAAERARKLDPLSVNAQVAVGTAYRAAGQHDRAISELRRALEMSAGNTRVQFQLGVTFVGMGRLDEAITALEPAARSSPGHNSRVEAYLGYAYAAAGRAHDAREVLNELESHRRDQYVSSFGIALIHDALGEKEPALAALQRAFEERAVEFGLMRYPAFRTIGSEPRFQAIMRQVGLPH